MTVENKDTLSRFVSIYLDGVLSGVKRYVESDMFDQTNAETIKLGSNSCGLDIYSIRVYDKALSAEEILNNYIADTIDTSTKLQLAADNNVLDDNGNISYDAVKSQAKIPIITFTGAMPTYKGDKKKNSVRMKFEDPNNPDLNFDELLEQIDVQGTSSQYYPRRNYKIKTKTEYDEDGKDRVHIFLNRGPFAADYNADISGVAMSPYVLYTGQYNAELTYYADKAGT